MGIMDVMDSKADELLEKIGIKNEDLQNAIEVGGVLLVGYLIYRIWRTKNGKTK